MNLDALAPADRELWQAMGEATPRFTSSPTPGAAHELAACRAVAAMLGTPLMPWQEWTIRLVTERRLDDPTRYRYPFYMLTVPRQAGKTTLVRVVLLTRALVSTERRAFYTAQTGKDATERWAELCAAVMRRDSPLAPLVTLRKAAGSARLTILPTGSRLSPFAPTPESLHGYTPHDVAVDELFAFTDAEGTDLEGAIIPAQVTLADRQLLALSTAGHRLSTYLRRKVDEGRLAARSGEGDAGYCEWSLADGLDPWAPSSWLFHPAVGHTQRLDDIALAAEQLPPGEFLRAIMNVWTEDTEPLFDMARYDVSAVGELAPVALGSTVLGVGVAADRSRAAVVAAWPIELDGRPRIAVRLVKDFDASTVPTLASWLRERATAPQADRPVIYGPGSSQQTRAILDDVRRSIAPYVVVDNAAARLDVRLVELDAREWQLASTQLHAAIVDGALAVEQVDSAGVLRSGVERAVARPGLDGAWQLSPSSSPESIALAAAVRGVRVKVDTPQIKIRL